MVGATPRFWDETWSIPGIGASQPSAGCGDILFWKSSRGAGDPSQDGDRGTRRGLRIPSPAHRTHQHPQAERLKATTILISASSWGCWAATGARAVSLGELIPMQPPANAEHQGQGSCSESAGTLQQLESPTPQRQEGGGNKAFYFFLIQASLPSANSGGNPFHVLNPALKLAALKAAFAACLYAVEANPSQDAQRARGEGGGACFAQQLSTFWDSDHLPAMATPREHQPVPPEQDTWGHNPKKATCCSCCQRWDLPAGRHWGI